MPLTPTADIVAGAAKAGAGVGSFNVIQVEHAEAIAAGAEAAGAPVILQISENCVNYHGGLGAIGAAALAVAGASDAPVAVHLDHATDPRLAYEAVMESASVIPVAGPTIARGEGRSRDATLRSLIPY